MWPTGRVNAQQLQSLRRLTPRTAALLERRWKQDLKLAEDAKRRIEHRGSGFVDADTNRRIEAAAIAAVTRHYEGRGWEVESVESQQIGYDLRCRRGRVTQRVEVKGTQSLIPSFIITEGERAASIRESAWVLCVVTKAMTKAPKLKTGRWARTSRLLSSYSPSSTEHCCPRTERSHRTGVLTALFHLVAFNYPKVSLAYGRSHPA